MTDTSPLFAVVCTYGSDAHSLRSAALPDHIAYLRAYRHLLRFAGPTLANDGCRETGSAAIVDMPDRASAELFVSREAFNRAGMFSHIEILRFTSVIGARQVDLSSDDGQLRFLGQWRGKAATAIPDDGCSEPVDGTAGIRVLEAGPLVTDDAGCVLGGLFIVEAGSRKDVEGFLQRDAHRRSTAVEYVRVTRWRFGRALSGT